MRKVIVLICSATLILCIFGIAGASPFTDSKYLVKWVSEAGHYPWEHGPPYDFGGHNWVVTFENSGMTAWPVSDENISIFFSGKASGVLNKGSWWTPLNGWTGVGIENVLVGSNAGDPLKINPANNNMKSSKLFSSIFIFNFKTSSAPTPEPANLLMLGFGLIGVSFLGRKIFTPKTHRG